MIPCLTNKNIPLLSKFSSLNIRIYMCIYIYIYISITIISKKKMIFTLLEFISHTN
jgi:hypothetical protein